MGWLWWLGGCVLVLGFIVFCCVRIAGLADKRAKEATSDLGIEVTVKKPRRRCREHAEQTD